jgi:heme exporter protein A
MQEAVHTARIVAHDLACRRGDRVLFRGLSFDLRPGQAMHVSGANGIGKSSLLRLAAGLSRPFAGRIAHNGTIGLVDERAALDPELPLAKALTFWNRLDCGTSSSLEALGLAHLLDVPVRYLSTGQRKRAAMARLLGQGAAVWLLDEPLNGLDREAARLIEDLTAAHCATGGVALIASHQTFTLPQMMQLALADYAA